MTDKLSLRQAKTILESSELPLLLTDGNESYRGVFKQSGMLAIVKYFPEAEKEDRWSVKFYSTVDTLAKTMTYWHTNKLIVDESMIRTMSTTLMKVVSKLRTYGEGDE